MEALRITLFGHVTVVRTSASAPLKLSQDSYLFTVAETFVESRCFSKILRTI